MNVKTKKLELQSLFWPQAVLEVKLVTFYLLNCFSRIPLNVHSPEEVCVPVCQMLSCLDKRPLKQTEMSHLITGFHVACFCKRSFHKCNPLEVEHIYRNPLVLFILASISIRAWASRTSVWHIQLIFTFLCHESVSVSMFFYMSVRPMDQLSVVQRVRIQTLCNVQRLTSPYTHIYIVGFTGSSTVYNTT